jgi:hypothetical protein
VAADRSASRIALLDNAGTLSLFREEESAEIPGPMPAIARMHLSADGLTLIAVTRTGSVFCARLDQGGAARLRPLSIEGTVVDVDLAPAGDFLAAARADGTVAVAEISSLLPDSQADTAAATILTGHGAPLTAMSLSPDGELLATASVDGRLRLTNLAVARIVAALPLADLPSGPAAGGLQPQPLDSSPYDPPPAEPAEAGEQFGVIHGSYRDLERAESARERAVAAGFADARIYLRQGWFRNVVPFPSEDARDAAMTAIRVLSNEAVNAYARDLTSWCPDAVEGNGVFECAAPPVAPPSPPAAAK